MAEKYQSNLTGKIYTLSVTAEPYIDEDTGVKFQHLYSIRGYIDGKPVLLDRPCSYQHAAITYMYFRLQRFVDGLHHITQYADFPEIAQAMGAK